MESIASTTTADSWTKAGGISSEDWLKGHAMKLATHSKEGVVSCGILTDAGLIDDIRIYALVLSTEEIAALAP